jgi:hypothetical protein
LLRYRRQCFVGVENTSDISSKSSIGSLLAAATDRACFDDAMPVVVAELLLDGECEHNVVTAANRASATNPEINRRFMETSVWLDMQVGVHHPHYAQRRPANVVCLTYHDVVLTKGLLGQSGPWRRGPGERTSKADDGLSSKVTCPWQAHPEALYRHAHDNRFDKLAVVAPAKILGDLRQAFHPEVSERIIGEIAKELTSHPIPHIEKLMAALR